MSIGLKRWKELSGGVRLSLLVGIVVIAALTIGAFWWLMSDEYQVLFTDLDPRDAASVVTALDRMEVDYSLEKEGTQILVPGSSVHEVRLKLMESGVPLAGGVGFEVFDGSDFGMTEFAQRINYQRALEGELTRTIMSLKEVKYARIHLVMPEKGVFQQDDSPPSASVTLFLETGHRPDSNQILGIQRLVSAAVPKLKPWQVTVTDQDSRTLSRLIADNDEVSAVSGRLEQKRAVEKYLTDKVMEVLEGNFGPHQALVSIDVDLNFNQVKRTREAVIPSGKQKDSGGVIRQREMRMGTGKSSNGDSGNVTTEVEYRLGRSIDQIVETPGEIIRLSVGVMVPTDTPDDRRQKISELVKMTVGFNSSRGDAIAVYAIKETMKTLASAKTSPQDGGEGLGLQGMTAGIGSPPQSGANKIEADSMDTNLPDRKQVVAWLGDNIVGVASVTAIFLCLLIALYYLRPKAGSGKPLSLSDAERKQVLENIRLWLDQADEPERDEVG